MTKKDKFSKKINSSVKGLIEIKESERKWHFPVLAGICVGACLFVGWFFDRPEFGNISSMGAMTILYFTHASLERRIFHLIVCAFMMTFSFMVGLTFSFSLLSAAISLAILGFIIHIVVAYFDNPPPGNFFFIMVAMVATNVPYDVYMLPLRVGLFAMGSMLSVFFALFYSVFIAKKVVEPRFKNELGKNKNKIFFESSVLSITLFVGFLIGYYTDDRSPYWIPLSALAVLQGKNLSHSFERNLHRILGTFLGMGLTWIIFYFKPNVLAFVLIVTILQYIIETFIVRNYLFAAIFITPLTILLAEAVSGLQLSSHVIIQIRFFDTLIGSLLGFVASTILYKKHFYTKLIKK